MQTCPLDRGLFIRIYKKFEDVKMRRMHEICKNMQNIQSITLFRVFDRKKQFFFYFLLLIPFLAFSFDNYN